LRPGKLNVFLVIVFVRYLILIISYEIIKYDNVKKPAFLTIFENNLPVKSNVFYRIFFDLIEL